MAWKVCLRRACHQEPGAACQLRQDLRCRSLAHGHRQMCLCTGAHLHVTHGCPAVAARATVGMVMNSMALHSRPLLHANGSGAKLQRLGPRTGAALTLSSSVSCRQCPSPAMTHRLATMMVLMAPVFEPVDPSWTCSAA